MITAPLQKLLETLDPPSMTARPELHPAATVDLAPSEIDTIIVPAREESFKRTFLAENRWHHVRIHPRMLPRIKYIAVYRSAPISAITHVALVRDIARCVNAGEDSRQNRQLRTRLFLGAKVALANWQAL
jgi:hypothetical protein